MMNKKYQQLKRKLAMFVALLCLMPLIPLTAWGGQNIISTVTTSEQLSKSSTVYVGEVVVDGVSEIKYLYSGDITSGLLQNLIPFLNGMADGDYATMLQENYSTQTNGLALCNDATLAAAMDGNWSSAQYVGTLYFPDKSVVSVINDNLYDLDEGFKALVDADNTNRVADINNPIDAEKSIVIHVDVSSTDNVYYTVEDGEIVKHVDTNVYYPSEVINVIYTKVELGTTPQPLTFEAVEAGTIIIENPNGLTIEYNQNNNGWTSSSANPISISVAANDVVLFRGDNACYWSSGDSGEEVTRFTATNPVYVYGNVMSLIDKDDFATVTTLTEEFALAYLFAAPSSSMYEFYAKNSTIRNHPTKDLVLPATTLTGTCYGYMFAGCEGLTRAPQLPATTLAMGCYHQMFADCTGLTTAPELNAPTLADMCYSSMFYNCSSLNYVKCLATDFSVGDPTFGWMEGVAANGTFVKAAIVDLPRNENGIPAGWTIEVADGVGTSATLTANADGEGNYWTTYYNGMASVSADDNTTVFTAKVSDDKTQMTLTEVTDGVIPAGNAVVMMSSAANVTLTVTDATGSLSYNDLLGQSESFTTPDNLFALSKGTSGVGFYRYPTKSGLYSTQFPAQKAYLIISGGVSARTFVPFGDSAPTAVQSVPSTADDADAPLYDLTGRRVTTQPQPGIYVKNGKVLIIK